MSPIELPGGQQQSHFPLALFGLRHQQGSHLELWSIIRWNIKGFDYMWILDGFRVIGIDVLDYNLIFCYRIPDFSLCLCVIFLVLGRIDLFSLLGKKSRNIRDWIATAVWFVEMVLLSWHDWGNSLLFPPLLWCTVSWASYSLRRPILDKFAHGRGIICGKERWRSVRMTSNTFHWRGATMMRARSPKEGLSRISMYGSGAPLITVPVSWIGVYLKSIESIFALWIVVLNQVSILHCLSMWLLISWFLRRNYNQRGIEIVVPPKAGY